MKAALPCQVHDPDLWFPVGTSGPALLQAESAKMHCYTCPIQVECLDAALERGETAGIWGGHTEEERRNMRRSSGRIAERVNTGGVKTGRAALNRALASS